MSNLSLVFEVVLLEFVDTFPKLCPIVSATGTVNYDLARFLCDLFSPVKPYDYSLKDPFSFVSQIKNANLCGKFLVSYNVTSIFINIPLQKTIDIAINIIFNHNSNLNIAKKEFKRLLLFATSQTHFLFNGKFYNQFDGVTMVLPWLLSLLIFSLVFKNLNA